MRAYRLDHLADAELLRNLASLICQDRCLTASLLAHIAEVDARRLFAPAGYPSMHAYCVGELRLSEDAAAKRIHAARAARAFPQFLDALAQGRIHLSGLCVLAAHLRPDNADQLLAAATHRTRSAIEQLVAERFPRSEAMALVTPVAAPSLAACQHAPGHVDAAPEHAPGHVPAPTPARVAPIAAQRFVIQVTVSEQTHGKLEHLRALLSHALPGGELADVLDYALSTTITQLERRKFGATDRPRAPRQSTTPRHVPAHVRRAVHARDGGRCTFVADDGHRCESRRRLEFDHVEPLARGGNSTADNLRLRCRAHNQLAAEQTFGVGFMDEKREAARLAAQQAQANAERQQANTERERLLDVIAALRSLGCRAEQARQLAERSNASGLTLEQHVRAALRLGCAARVGRRERAGVAPAA